MNKQQKKLYVILSVLLTLVFTTKAFASLTFTNNAITGTTASTIDLGAGNALSLQTVNNGKILFGTGNVGIGITAPQAPLHVNRGAAPMSMILDSNSSGSTSALDFARGGSLKYELYNLAPSDTLNLWSYVLNNDVFFVKNNGDVNFANNVLFVSRSNRNVGILQTSPISPLDVFGGVTIGGSYSGISPAPANGMIVQGNVGIGTTSPGMNLEVNGGIRLNTATSIPTCNSSTRGTFWSVQGGAGVKDTVQVCAKDATDTYAWRTIY